MKKQILSEQFQRMQKLAGIITESPLTVGSAGEKQKLTEGFLGDVVKKLKNLFTGEKMEKVRDSDGYSYFKDEDGKEWIGVTRMDLRYEPGYQKSWVAIYDLKDESKIKQATSNAKAQNKKYMNVQDDPFSGGVVASTTMVGDYYPEPVKVINSKTF